MLPSQSVSIAGTQLHGDWLLTDSAPHSAALILPGSGPTDADGNQPGFTPNNLRDLGSELARQGIACLRIDKRGVGRSLAAGSTEAQLTFESYAHDAAQWMRWLHQATHGSLPLFILGHSEGALIGVLAAQRLAQQNGLAGVPRGVVSLCAPLRRASAVLRSQLLGKLPAHLQQISDEILKALESGQDTPICPSELDVLYRASVQPYLRSWFQYDPQQEVLRLACRHLWMWGDTDAQLPDESHYLTAVQMPAHKQVIVQGMNHAMHEVNGLSGAQRMHSNLITAVAQFCSVS